MGGYNVQVRCPLQMFERLILVHVRKVGSGWIVN